MLEDDIWVRPPKSVMRNRWTQILRHLYWLSNHCGGATSRVPHEDSWHPINKEGLLQGEGFKKRLCTWEIGGKEALK